MDITPLIILLTAIFCFAIGFTAAYLLRGTQAKDARAVAEQLIRQSELQRKNYETQMVDLLQGKFSALSLQAIKQSQDTFLTLAQERFGNQTKQHAQELEYKKNLIDQQLSTMNTTLSGVTKLVTDFEEKSVERLGALGSELKQLNETSSRLQQALGDSTSRGQWGERMAEDILKMMGFVEGINYEKQITSDSSADTRIRPDFTFRLPNGMALNMDSKFPLTNYMAYMSAQADTDKAEFRKRFLGDVRARVKEICGKEYINANQNTINCVLIFIPNEQIYRFIHESDYSIIDEAMSQKVVICSPLTLFVVLSVIRQAVESFKLQQSSHDILQILNQFKHQWGKYVERMDDIGKGLERAESAYRDVVGLRQRALQAPMSKIDDLMRDYGLDDQDAPVELTQS